jgi:hypothetical protein
MCFEVVRRAQISNNNNNNHRCVDCSDSSFSEHLTTSLTPSSCTTVFSEVPYPMPAKERTKTAQSPSNDTCQQQFSPLFISPFPSRARTPKPNRRLLPRCPKQSDAAACTRYRLRNKGTLIDEICSLIHRCRREAQAYNHLATTSLANSGMFISFLLLLLLIIYIQVDLS